MQFETKTARNKESIGVCAKLHCSNNYNFLLPAFLLPDKVVHSRHTEPSLSCHCERPTGTWQSRRNNWYWIAAVSQGLPCNDRKAAFSLVEMLMALLVASLLLAALAPVMTRRISENLTVIAMDKSSTGYKIFTPDDADCEEVEGQNYKKCTFKTPNDVYSLNIYMQAAGGGGAAATKGANKKCSYDTKTGNISESPDCKPVLSYCSPLFIHQIPCKEVPIEEGIMNFRSIVIGPGGGGGGAVGRIECNNTNHKYLTSAQNGNNGAACVTKYNVGESASAPVSVTILPSTTSCSGLNCCWRTPGSHTSCNNSQNWNYSGCGRVLCTYTAGSSACSAYAPAGSWRLPTYNEMQGWRNSMSEINTNQGNEGLMLCDAGSTSPGVSKCDALSGCNGTCYPYALTGGPYSGTYAEFYLAGSFNGKTEDGYGAQSFRCITTNSNLWGWKSYSGSGGSSGAVIMNSPTSKMDELVQQYEGWNFYLFARDGYSGAEAVALDKTESNSAQIRENQWDAGYLVRKDGSTSNALGTFGGAGSNSSLLTASVAGLGGKLYTAGAAPYYAGACYNAWGLTSQHGYSCTPGNKGGVGTTNSNGASTGAGGKGGSISYTLNGSNINCSGGNGGSVSNGNQNGSSATCYGAGGGGAASWSTANGKGGNGGDGYAQVAYDVKRIGSAGGGGGAGAQLSMREIEVEPNKVYYFYVGKGGKGGFADADDKNGKDGGDSWFEIKDGDKVIAHGGKGGMIGNDETKVPTSGKGGEGGKYTNASKAATKENGKNGSDGFYNASLKLSVGGNGGMANGSETYTCGGMFKKENNPSQNADCVNNTANGQSFSYIFETLVQSLLNKSKADAGQGGGGGTYVGNPGNGSAGNGGNGTDGYIYIRWNVLK